MRYLFYKVFVVVLMLAAAATSQIKNQREALILNDLGITQFKKSEYAEALSSLNRAIELYPTAPAFHSNLGHVYRELEDLARSEIAFRKSNEIQPDNAITLNQLGVVLMEANV